MPNLNLSTWLTEDAAAKRIGVSVRTLRRMAEQRKVERQLRPVQGKRPEPVYNPEDIASFTVVKPFIPSRAQNGAGSGKALQLAHASASPSLDQFLKLIEKINSPVYERFAQALEAVTRALPAAHVATEKRFMTFSEGAEYLSVTEAFLRRWVRKLKIPVVRDREGIKIRKADLDNLASSQAGDRIGRNTAKAGG